MDFAELCATVGALRARVADLEAKEAERNKPVAFDVSIAGGGGCQTIRDLAEAAVKRGLQAVPEISRRHNIRFD